MMAVVVKGGMVQEVISDKEQKVMVIDLDVEGSNKSRLSWIPLHGAKRVLASLEHLESTIKPEFFEQKEILESR